MTGDDATVTHDAEDLEAWTVTIPRQGTTGGGTGIQGIPTERWFLTQSEGDRLEGSLKRFNVAQARRGRPRYWRGDREVIGRLPDGEERHEVTAIAEEVSAPNTANLDASTRSLEAYRNALEREIVELQARKASIWADLAQQEANAAERHQLQLRRQAEHLLTQTERLRAAEGKIYEGFKDELERYAGARTLLGELQPRDALAEALREARHLVESAAGSTFGQLGALFASTAMAQKMSDKYGNKGGDKITPQKLLDAALYQGEAFRLRLRTLREWITTQQHPCAAAMATAADFLVGDVPADALARHTAR